MYTYTNQKNVDHSRVTDSFSVIFLILMKTPSSSVPILVMAYSRPNQTLRLLSEIETLTPREVHISVDGIDMGSKPTQNNTMVKEIVNDWSIKSKHAVTFSIYETNLGLLAHFKTALKSFFTLHEAGIILEDDIEFDNAFIEYVDSMHGANTICDYWSICAHNPIPSSDKSNFPGRKITMVETNVHTIWGWASTRENVISYLTILELEKEQVFTLMNAHISFVSSDPLIRYLLRENWRRKLQRFYGSDKPNWDNLWIVAGWNSGKKSLIPRISLARENPDQSEGQTHRHESKLPFWDRNSQSVFEVVGIEENIDREFERELMKVWGVTRKRALQSLLQKVLRMFRLRRRLHLDMIENRYES